MNIRWFDATLLDLKRVRRKSERKALTSGFESDWPAYQISQCANDSKKLFKMMNLFCDDITGNDLQGHC